MKGTGYPVNRNRIHTQKFTPALTNLRGGPEKLPSMPKKRNKPNYKIPKTPKVSGQGWGY